MGCAASREKLAAVDLPSANGQMTPDQCVNRDPAKKQTAFILKEKFFSWGGDFDIKDETGAVKYKVKGAVMTMRDKMVIYDPSGKALCMLQKKLLSWTPCYQVYTYKPNFKGQESTETDDKTPVYRFAIIDTKFFSCPQQYTYSLYATSNDEPVQLWSAVEVCPSWRFQMVIDSAAGVSIAKVGQTTLLQFDAANEYAVEVAVGVDPLGMLCLAIAGEQIRDARNRRSD